MVLALAAALSVALVAAVLHQGADPTPSGPPNRVVLGAATAATVDRCDDTLLLTVDGGGEQAAGNGRPGRTVEVFRRAIMTYAATAGRSVNSVGIELDAAAPRALVGTSPGTTQVKKSLTAQRVRLWRKPVATGVQRAVSALDQATLECPSQQVLLAGYAQGAAVVHRVLVRLQVRPEGLVRIAGVALVSDPDRRSRSTAALLGAPVAGSASSGLFPRFLEAVADVPPPSPTYSVFSVCTAGDLVCDPRNNRVKDALRLARSYHSGSGARQVRAAAAATWRTVRQWPVPRPDIQVVSSELGQPVSLQLSVDVLPGVAAGVVWSDAQQLPPGMTLSAGGLLSGVPTGYGTWNITYLVANTAPVTTAVPGVVVLTVAAESTGVSAGGQSTCEVRTDTTTWCWGRNNFGQLGNGSVQPSVVPVEVAGTAGWSSVSTSGSTTCGTKTTGTLWCWGLNNFGQLGIGRGKSRSTPVQVGTSTAWTSVSTSWFHTCATRANGTLWCWGSNLRGQLGNGGFENNGSPSRVGQDSDWASVSTGGFSTCAVRQDGGAWCWGQNVFGQNANANESPQPRPTLVPGGLTWAEVSAGWAHTCGVTLDGAAWCWGLNNRGQLGDGTRTLRRAPVPVSGARIWTTLSVGDATSCGVDNTGAAWCWGSNNYAQLGDGSRTHRSVPVLVRSERPWLSIDAGWFHECGAQDDGMTACWGNNELGQIGNGSRQDQPAPEEVR